MKKIVLLLSLAVSALSANAQLYLSGASPYTQDFDALGTAGVPTGWGGYTGSAPNSLGSLSSPTLTTSFGVYDTLNGGCKSAVYAGGFKNYPSADVSGAADTCSVQQGRTDRAFGVRQTGSSSAGLDSGAAFVLKLANTNGMSSMNIAFKLQSLDTTSHRTTTWRVQYGLGTNPTSFTDLTTSPATLTTGGGMFTNTNVTANLPASLDNQSSVVTMRIVTLEFSSGSGNRPSTAIDDFTLNWTGTAKMGVATVNGYDDAAITVLGTATSDNITFAYDVIGNNTLTIYDLAGRAIHTQAVDAAANQMSVTGLHLAPGMYIAKISNGNAQATAKVMVF